jgi:hypothetical protein
MSWYVMVTCAEQHMSSICRQTDVSIRPNICAQHRSARKHRARELDGANARLGRKAGIINVAQSPADKGARMSDTTQMNVCLVTDRHEF